MYAAISMWETGDFVDEPFRAEKFAPVYDVHESALLNMKKKSVNAYHKIMSTLYREVRCVLTFSFF